MNTCPCQLLEQAKIPPFYFHVHPCLTTSLLLSFTDMAIPNYDNPASFNPARLQTIDWIQRQLQAGFQPKWFISAHFRCPTETGNHRTGSKDVSAKALRQYSWAVRRRNDPDFFSKDVGDLSNKLQNVLWWSDSDSVRKSKTNSMPTLWVVEKGVLQYHVHLLIPDPYNVAHSAEGIERAWRRKLVPMCRCLSNSNRSVKAVAIGNLPGLLNYVTKQVTASYPAVDYKASTLNAPPPSLKPSSRPRAIHYLAPKPRPDIHWPPQSVQEFKAGRNWSPASR